MKVLEGKSLLHYSIQLAFHSPPIVDPARIASTSTAAPPPPPPPKTREEIALAARDLIVEELRRVLNKDIRERIVTRKVLESIDEFRAQRKANPPLVASTLLPPASDTMSNDTPPPISLKSLNFRFKKKPGAVPAVKPKVEPAPVEPESESDRPPPETKKRSFEELEGSTDVPDIPEPSPSDADTTPQPEKAIPVPRKKNKKVKIAPVVEEVTIESEDDNDDTTTVEDRLRAAKHKRRGEDSIEPSGRGKKRKVSAPKTKRARKEPAVKVEPVVEVNIPTVESESEPMVIEVPQPEPEVEPESEPEPPKPRPKPRNADPLPTEAKPPLPPLDPFELNLVDPQDDEELYFLQQGLLRRKAGHSLPGAADEEVTVPPIRKRHPALRVNLTGSARTEGYYKIPEAHKSLYLPERNQAAVTVAAQAHSTGSGSARNNGTSSRSNRVNSRKLVQGMEQANKYLMQLGGSDASDNTLKLKFNQLRTRKKKLKFSRSPIHDWGLYAMEPISAGEMVIEYVGEVIRQQVADKREKYYERTGIGSSYLFRVDDDAVVDATKKGNLG